MHYNTLPGTDVSVSRICVGTMNWGTFNTEPEAHDQLDYAIAEGCNFIDTAEIYPIPPSKERQGLTEKYLGDWMKKRGNRNDLIIASKVASRNQAGGMSSRDVSEGLTKKNIREAIDGTLMRLQTEYVDLYQVHVPDRKSNYFGVRWYEDRMDAGGASIEETL
jgi:aryl-alcohol dehydrogenase-like predicted oxidoreductase